MKYEFKNGGTMEIVNSAERAELYFYGDIVSDKYYASDDEDSKCPSDVAKFLKQLEDSKGIDIFINSGGGSVHGGLAIYNMLKRIKAKKRVYIDGIAASIASIIALAGDEVYISSNSHFMVHKPLTFMFGAYNADELQETIKVLDVCQKSIMQIYAENAKSEDLVSIIEDMVNAETWLVGEEVCKYFNIELMESNKEIVACSSEIFTKYKNVPKNLKISTKSEKIEPVETSKETSDDLTAKAMLEEEKRKILDDIYLI